MAQGQLPSTELWAIAIEEITDTSLEWSQPSLLSFQNSNGYNNQVSTHADGFALTIAKEGDEQTDICFFNLENREFKYLTSTRTTSEYSARIMTADSIFYVVRVDTNGDQNLWALPLSLSHGGENILAGVNNVGYYDIISKDSFVVFLTGQPHQLALLTKQEAAPYVFTSNIGRTFFYRDGDVYFVHKLTPTTWYLKAFNVKGKKSRIITKMPTDTEDFLLMADRSFLIFHEGQIKRYQQGRNTSWQPVADLSNLPFKKITRLAYDGHWLYLINKTRDAE